MEVKSSVYNQINGLQSRDAKKIIDLILKNLDPRKVDVIVDVGCGSGNVTKLLAKSIPHERLLAFDIDPKMVRFAVENHSDENIEYIVQDVSLPWDDLHPKIRALKGSVNLIFSNYVLHWVKEMDTAFENLLQLLKPGGVIYFNVGGYQSLFHSISLKEQEQIEKSFVMDSPEVQRSKFRKSLTSVGFTDLHVQPENNSYEFETAEACQEMLKLFRNLFFTFIVPDPEDAPEELKSKIEDLVFRTYSVKTGHRIPEEFDFDQRLVFYDTFWGWAKKPGENNNVNEG